MEQTTLEVSHLFVRFRTDRGVITPVNDVSLRVPEGKIVGIVGESGCGKSMTARAVMGLVRFPGEVTGGTVRLCSREITALSEAIRDKLLPKMAELRAVADEAEVMTAKEYWPFPTYGEILFAM